jgi:hypothetical protein
MAGWVIKLNFLLYWDVALFIKPVYWPLKSTALPWAYCLSQNSKPLPEAFLNGQRSRRFIFRGMTEKKYNSNRVTTDNKFGATVPLAFI